MTSGRATKRRRRAERHDATEEAFVAAWCAGEDDIVEANKATHDALIRMLGARRRGGTTWRVYVGGDALRVLGMMLGAPGNSTELANYYRRIRALLREQGGYLVVASAPAVPA
jgi:hypothetical protein